MGRKSLYSTIVILLVVGGGFLGYKLMQRPTLYPYMFTLEDKTKETVQIYQGTWAATGGSAFDSSGRLQIRKDGKIVDLPIVAQQQTNASGQTTFMLPAGTYFVYIANPIYDDDLPRDITIPADTKVTISSDKH